MVRNVVVVWSKLKANICIFAPLISLRKIDLAVYLLCQMIIDTIVFKCFDRKKVYERVIRPFIKRTASVKTQSHRNCQANVTFSLHAIIYDATSRISFTLGRKVKMEDLESHVLPYEIVCTRASCMLLILSFNYAERVTRRIKGLLTLSHGGEISSSNRMRVSIDRPSTSTGTTTPRTECEGWFIL